MTTFRWGVFGTGAIVPKFVAGLRSAADASLEFVASRDLGRAERLAADLGAHRAIRGYDAAAAEGGVDAIYIATPPSEHVAHGLLALEAGIPVLIEKPFATTGPGARQLAEAARSSGVFAMEAMWTRFLPAARALQERVASGGIGDVRLVAGEFGQSLVPDPRNSMFNPDLGGGALAHLAPYPLSLGQWLFGTPKVVTALGRIGDSGVDEDVAFQIAYPEGVLGSFHVSIRSWAPDGFRVMGTHGMAGVRGSIVRSHGLAVALEEPLAYSEPGTGWKERLRQNSLVHQLAQRLDRSSRGAGRAEAHRYAGNGYQYEADEVATSVRAGRFESDVMPLDDSIAVATTIDEIKEAVARRATEGGR
jgi:predicted dehydrogenase